MVSAMQVSVDVGLNTSAVHRELSSLKSQMGSDADAIGRLMGEKLLNARGVKSQISEIMEAMAKVKRAAEFSFKVADIGSSAQGGNMLKAMSRQLDVLKVQFDELERQKTRLLSAGPPTAIAQAAINRIAAEQKALTEQRGELIGLRPQLRSRTQYLEGAESAAAAIQAAAAAKITAQNRIAIAQGHVQMRNWRQSVMLGHEDDIAAAVAATQAGKAKQQAAAGGGGRMNSMFAVQASYGLQDFITVMAGGGSFQQAMIGATNNLGMMFMNVEKLEGGFKGLLKSIRANQGALAGLAITAMAVSLPSIIESVTAMARGTTAAEIGDRGSIVGLQRANSAFERGRGHIAHGAGFASDLALQIQMIRDEKGGTLLEREGAKRAFTARDKEMKRLAESMKGEDAADLAGINANEAQRDFLDQTLRNSRFAEIIESRKTGLGPTKAMLGMSGITSQEMEAAEKAYAHGPLKRLDPEKTKELERERDAIDEDIKARKANIQARYKDTQALLLARESMQKEVARENQDRIREQNIRFKKIEDRMQAEGIRNPFERHGAQIRLERDERLEELQKEFDAASDPAEKARIKGHMQAVRAAANGRFGRNQLDAEKSRLGYLTGLKSGVRGAPSVEAIKDRYNQLLKDIDEQGFTPQQKRHAQQLALTGAQQEVQQVIRSNMAPAEFNGIEGYLSKLQTELLNNSDQKDIRKATMESAETLKQILDKTTVGAVAG